MPNRRQEEVARIIFKTQLNLTRFLQAQRLKQKSRLDHPQLASEHVLAISPDDRWYRDEIPLRPSTNIIIGPDQKYAFALKHPRARQLRQYLNLVQDLLSRVIDDAFEGSTASARYAYIIKGPLAGEQISCEKGETYEEFSARVDLVVAGDAT